MAKLIVTLLVLQTAISGLLVVRLNAVVSAVVPPAAQASLLGEDVASIELGDSPAKGASQPAVTIVEFSDFTCGACREIQPVLDELMARHGDETRLVFKYFPLRPQGPSMDLAVAAECARDQGAFWPMHDAIFAPAGSPAADISQLAVGIGLEPTQFERCLAADASRATVERDLDVARKLDIPGTPTLFINGRRLVGVPSLEDLEQAVATAKRAA